MDIEGYELSLAFANKSDWRSPDRAGERLQSFETAVDWALGVGILDEAQAGSLRRRARGEPEELAAALPRLVAFREAVYRIFTAAAHGEPPSADDLQMLNAELTEAMVHLRLSPERPDSSAAQRYGWRWVGLDEQLTSMLWPVAVSAAGLLTSPQLVRLRDCANTACGWLFIDRSKNASRRWCDMGECGNRAKARRFRERQKSETGRDP